MNTARFIFLSSFTVSLTASLLSACSSYSPPPPAPIVSSEIVTSDSMYGVVESIQLVQVVPPPASAGMVPGEPVAPTHSAYQIGVRFNHGGYQVFTQDEGAELRVGQQVRVERGIVHRG